MSVLPVPSLRDTVRHGATRMVSLREPWLGLQRRLEASGAAALFSRTGAGDFPLFQPRDPWPGRVEIADALFQGHYAFAGTAVHAPRQSPWRLHPPSEAWAEALHGFTWLRHFAASGGEAARRQARALVESWLEEGQRRAVAWRPQVMAHRLIAWTWHAPFVLGTSAPMELCRALARSAQNAARHLGRTARAAAGPAQITAAVGLVYAGLALPKGARRRRKGLGLLQRALTRQILADGGHISRSPSFQHSVLADLCALRRALEEAGEEVPDFLQQAIDGMAPMLRFYRHGDGGLALFNGAHEESDGMVDWTLALAEAPGTHVSHARESGFFRLAAGRSVLLCDAGAPPPAPHDRLAHAGCLSFELSSGRQRLIVNCGSGRLRGPDWQHAMRTTAAHSTLVVDDKSSCRFRHGAALRLLGEGITRGPHVVEASQTRQDGRQWIEVGHDGYAAAFGLLHRRRLYLDENGTDLRGEDRLEPAPGGSTPVLAKVPFAIRFHLHPDVHAARDAVADAIVLSLPDGESWSFRARGGETALEDSIYLGMAEAVRPTQQIVVAHVAGALGATVNWALQRIARAEAPPEETAPPE